jgi:hypothetical protein
MATGGYERYRCGITLKLRLCARRNSFRITDDPGVDDFKPPFGCMDSTLALSSYAICGSLHEICRPHNSAEYQQSDEALLDLHALSPQVYRGDCACRRVGQHRSEWSW